MDPRRRRLSSVYDIKPVKYDDHHETNGWFLEKLIKIGRFRLTIGNLICIVLSLITIAIQSTALFTSNWKEVSPKTPSFYIDNVDALIRNDAIIYFNTMHRFSRHSFGLFRRCEYSAYNISSGKTLIVPPAKAYLSGGRGKKSCAKNLIPSYTDEQFDQCHSLEYYRFCSKTNSEIFDITNDYLQSSFHLEAKQRSSMEITFFCNCDYPSYIQRCRIAGLLGLIFLSCSSVLLIIFPIFTRPDHRLQLKLGLVLSSIVAVICAFITVLTAHQNQDFEIVEYFRAFERHYASQNIYPMVEDVRKSIHQILNSVEIQIGYSAILAWLAVGLSLIDVFLIIVSCKLEYHLPLPPLQFMPVPPDSEDGSRRGSITSLPCVTTMQESHIPRTPSTTTQAFRINPDADREPLTVLTSIPETSPKSSDPHVHFSEEE